MHQNIYILMCLINKMKKAYQYLISILILLTLSSSVIAATCTVNGKEISCDIFWIQYGWIFVVCFLGIGLLFLIKPDWVLLFQGWNSEKLMGAKFIPSKRTHIIVRVMGAIFAILGLICLCMIFFR
jgi:hypothetical protein